MTPRPAFRRFVALDECDAPQLLQRMANHELQADGERYGIRTRLIAKPAVGVAHLAVAVLMKLLATCEIPASYLGGMVLSSRIVDIEQTAREVAVQAGVNGPAAGVERACSGFPAATQRGVQLCEELQRPIAIVTAEIISRNINWEPSQGEVEDRQRARGQAAKLFADGAAAGLIEPGGDSSLHTILDAWVGEVPDEKQLIQKADVENALDPWGRVRPGHTSCLTMPGRRGFLLLRRAPRVMAESLLWSVGNARRAGLLGQESVGEVVPHQANGLITEGLASLLRQELSPPPRVWDCIDHAGNTVSASIPNAMASVQDQLSSGAIVAMPSVGAGGPGYRPDVLSTGCVLIRSGTTS